MLHGGSPSRRAFIGGSLAVCLLSSCTDTAEVSPRPPSTPIDNTESARATVEQIMQRLKDGDIDAAKAVMTDECIKNEGFDGGWLDAPPAIGTYRIESTEAIKPRDYGPSFPYRAATNVRVAYTVTRGQLPYNLPADNLLMVQKSDGSWLLHERRGFGGL
jgi:hypothetical protein